MVQRKLSGIYKGDPSEDSVTETIEPEPLFIFCNQVWLSGVGLKLHSTTKPSTFNLTCHKVVLGQWWHRFLGSSQTMPDLI